MLRCAAVVLLLTTFLLAGCAGPQAVASWEKGALAKPIMAFDPDRERPTMPLDLPRGHRLLGQHPNGRLLTTDLELRGTDTPGIGVAVRRLWWKQEGKEPVRIALADSDTLLIHESVLSVDGKRLIGHQRPIYAKTAFLSVIDYPELEPGIYELEGVVSRKKQLLPYLTHSLSQLGSAEGDSTASA